MISWEIDASAYKWMTEVYFGKRIITTSRHEWSDAEIIAAYQGQNHVEQVFKHLKNSYHHAVKPQFHWSDQKIKVLTFICLIVLLLSQLLWKKARETGYRMNVETMLEQLSEIRLSEIFTVHDMNEKPTKEEEQLEDMESELEKLYNTPDGKSLLVHTSQVACDPFYTKVSGCFLGICVVKLTLEIETQK